MGKFYLHKAGVLIQTGECPDGQEEFQAFNGAEMTIGHPHRFGRTLPCQE